MPCEECENGLYKWGETGECQYETLEDCQLANQGEYLEETLKPKYNHEEDVEYTLNFTEEQMKELHSNGELIVHVEDGDREMVIKFTYGHEEKRQEHEEEEEYYAKSRLNSTAYDYATTLIREDKIDKDSDWSFSTEEENALLGEDGDDWDNYAKWFLLEDEDANEETKERYKFPFGKDGKIYRKALTAIRQRAAQFNYDDVFEAAGKLIDMIDEEKALAMDCSVLTASMLDEELDEYINKIADSIKKLNG